MAAPGPCARERLAALAADRLDPEEEQAVRAHLRACGACRETLFALEPSSRFAFVPRRTLAPRDWAPVLAAVRAEVAAHPRPWAWLASGGRQGGWLTALGKGLAAAGLVAVTLALLRPVPGVPVAGIRALPARPGVPLDLPEGTASFTYLSNPRARVAHFLIAGSGESPVRLTMVVDDSIADLF